MAEPGRPAYTEDQYKAWLEAMHPFLANSNSLYYAIEQSGLIQHQTTIYEKYRLGDWFSQKIDRLRSLPGELVNDGIVSLIRTIVDKIKRKEALSMEETNILKFYAEKSRVSQQFFVNRQEMAQGPPLDKILYQLENDANRERDEAAVEARKQILEANKPVQNQGQAGQNSNIPPEPNTTSPSIPNAGT